MGKETKIAVVAIARDETPFMDEWLLYHRLIGVSHFFIYDDDPVPSLQDFLHPHDDYATVTRWYESHPPTRYGNQQIAAYRHALANFLPDYRWVAFIDIDEFIVLGEHENIQKFVGSLGNAPAVAMNWHRFGHNGHYEDPKGLVTAELTRRKFMPCLRRHKCITRRNAIANIRSVHHCELKNGLPVQTDVAHINHYMCRSFTRWLSRASRGDACDARSRRSNAWLHTKEGCLRRFVKEVALDWNEHVDEEMLQYKPILEKAVEKIRETRDTYRQQEPRP